MPIHGEYQPEKGFYDSSLKGWIRDPARLTYQIPKPPLTQSHIDQVANWGGQRPFKRNRVLDGFLRLRDSERPEDRANYEKIAAGSTRINISDYERELKQAQADGREVIG